LLKKAVTPVYATCCVFTCDPELTRSATSGLVGACQVNVSVPDLPPGDYPVTIQIGDAVSNAPLLSVGH